MKNKEYINCDSLTQSEFLTSLNINNWIYSMRDPKEEWNVIEFWKYMSRENLTNKWMKYLLDKQDISHLK